MRFSFSCRSGTRHVVTASDRGLPKNDCHRITPAWYSPPGPPSPSAQGRRGSGAWNHFAAEVRRRFGHGPRPRLRADLQQLLRPSTTPGSSFTCDLLMTRSVDAISRLRLVMGQASCVEGDAPAAAISAARKASGSCGISTGRSRGGSCSLARCSWLAARSSQSLAIFLTFLHPSSFIPHPSSLYLMATYRTGSIDAHAHWAPQAYVSYLAKLGRQAGSGAQSPLMSDLPARMKWMDERNVGMHVLTLSGGMPWQWAPQDAANKLARIVNDAAIEAHKTWPDRFVAGAALPIRDPAAALKELDRVAGAPGMRAVHLPNSIEGRDYIFEPAVPAAARALRGARLPAPLPSARRRGEPLRRAGAAGRPVVHLQLAGLSVRNRDDRDQVHPEGAARQVSEARHRAAAFGRLLPVRRGAHRAQPLPARRRRASSARSGSTSGASTTTRSPTTRRRSASWSTSSARTAS